MRTQSKLLFSLALAVMTASARADSMVYVVTGNHQFGTVNTVTGGFNAISATPEGDAGLVAGAGGLLLTKTVSGNLDSINPVTGATTVVGPTGLGNSVFRLAEVGGTLYATDFSNNLYTVNPTTGHATLIGATGMPGEPFAVGSKNADGTFNYCDESLFGIGGSLYATFDTFTLAADGASYTDVVDPELWKIDPITGIATKLAATADHILSSVDINGTVYAFKGTIDATHDFFSPGPLVQLVTLDLGNGAISVVTNVSGPPAFGVTPVPTPEPGSLALVGTGFVAIAAGWRRLRCK